MIRLTTPRTSARSTTCRQKGDAAPVAARFGGQKLNSSRPLTLTLVGWVEERQRRRPTAFMGRQVRANGGSARLSPFDPPYKVALSWSAGINRFEIGNESVP